MKEEWIMISGFIEWLKDWWNLPGEIRKMNEKTEGVSRANVIAFFVMLLSGVICLYLGYWIPGGGLILTSGIALIWNGEIATMLLKMSGYVLASLAAGAAIAGVTMLIFSMSFWPVMAGVSVLGFFGAVMFLGTD